MKERWKSANSRNNPPVARRNDFVRCYKFMIRIVLPFHLKNLARVEGEVQLEVGGPATVAAVLDAIEVKYPALRGTIRDHGTLKRRPFIRYFVCKEDWSLEPTDKLLPEEIVSGKEPFLVVGAMAGG